MSLARSVPLYTAPEIRVPKLNATSLPGSLIQGGWKRRDPGTKLSETVNHSMWLLLFRLSVKSLSLTIQMKATEQYFSKVLFVDQYFKTNL